MVGAVALGINCDASNKAISLFLACNMLIFNVGLGFGLDLEMDHDLVNISW